MKISIGKMFLENTIDNLTKASSVVEHASNNLMEMFNAAMDAPGGKYEYSSVAIYRVAAILEMVANSLNDRGAMFRSLNSASIAGGTL